MSKYFVDTNLVVYANDRRDPTKQLQAAALLRDLIDSDSGVISTQVMQEYAAVAIRKLQQEAPAILRQLTGLGQMEVIQLTPGLIRRAVELQALCQVNFWDACIIAAAESARCDVIYSEDLNVGQLYAGIRLVNPFTEGS